VCHVGTPSSRRMASIDTEISPNVSVGSMQGGITLVRATAPSSKNQNMFTSGESHACSFAAPNSPVTARQINAWTSLFF
jgi:hypothetical protein